MTSLQEKLFDIRDEKYGDFQSKLTPTVPRDRFIGVRVPELRKLAKIYIKSSDYEAFISALPHDYYEENVLHAILVSQIEDFETCAAEIERFLPYVDNWAVCDTLSPKIFIKHRTELLERINIWSASEHTYTCRFGLHMLMNHFLDEEFREELLEIPASIVSKEYYVNMMIAWFFATALAMQWDAALPYIEKRRLGKWTHEKTIQKACESFRISAERKNHLKALK